MSIALTPAIIAALRVSPPLPVVRDSLPRRSPPKGWAAPNAIDRGQLIDLVV
jgi:hypothetical protein